MLNSRSRVVDWLAVAIIAWATLTNLALALLLAGIVGWMSFSRF
jgi:hypothetical protein